MREFVSLLIMPISLFFLLLLAAFFFLRRKRKKTWKILFLLAGLWLLVITTKPIPSFLVVNLENKYYQVQDSLIKTLPDTINIIVLGGGFSDDKTLHPNDQLSIISMGRLVEGIRIYNKLEGRGRRAEGGAQSAGLRAQGKKELGDAGTEGLRDGEIDERSEEIPLSGTKRLIDKVTKVTLVLSGYGGRLSLTQAEVLAKTAVSLGVDPADIKLLTTTKNTSDEAKTYFREFGKKTKLILVTDAVHMPRAMKLFRKAGLDPVPAPTNHIIKHGTVKSPFTWMPSSSNIYKMEVAMHEYGGLVWSWIGGE
jgi:uncharacterized SAM-binding protein YcdF (DUF218 family)